MKHESQVCRFGCICHHETRAIARGAAQTLRRRSPSKRARWIVEACPDGKGWRTVRVNRNSFAAHAGHLAQAW